MIVLAYDHSFEGFLTAVFDLYATYGYGKNQVTAKIVRSGLVETDLFDQPINTLADTRKAQRVLVKLEKLISKQGVQRLLWAYLSERPELEMCLLGVISYAIDYPHKNIIKNFAHPHVMTLASLVKSVSRERHRMLAFVRFELMQDGLFFARIKPDFNVLPLITEHFRRRYKDQPWAIYDLKRNYGIYYDLTEIRLIDGIDPAALTAPDSLFSSEEKQYQAMWQGYFNHVNIPERVNHKLHVQQLPKRYWQYLTEKKINIL